MMNSEIWEEIKKELSQSLPPQLYRSWFAKSSATVADGTLVISVHNDHARHWMEVRGEAIIQKQLAFRRIVLPLAFVTANRLKDEQPVAVKPVLPHEPEGYIFPGFFLVRSHFTQVPNYLIEEVPHHVKPTTFILVNRIWRETWGVVNARGQHKEEWVTHLRAIEKLSGIAYNSVKTAISEGRKKGLIVQRTISADNERVDYIRATGERLHRNTVLIGLRPRWDDEPVDK